jgi:peptidoglycan/LPS O-acetylase OafA/YrhL
MRNRVVMIDAGFEAVLATVLLLGVVFGDIDARDFPAPASDLLLAIFAFALFGLAIGLASLVKNERVGDGVLLTLAVVNAGFAVLLAVWALAGGGFSTPGRIVVWVTVGMLLALAAMQLLARPPRR